MFTFEYSVKMFDTDASGHLFFTSQMRMAHEAYEAFMASAGLAISRILRTSDYLLPIVHAETDYKAASFVGDHLAIEITPERVGGTSFTLHYHFRGDDGQEVGTARTVHVAIDRESREKKPLPQPVRDALAKL